MACFVCVRRAYLCRSISYQTINFKLTIWVPASVPCSDPFNALSFLQSQWAFESGLLSVAVLTCNRIEGKMQWMSCMMLVRLPICNPLPTCKIPKRSFFHRKAIFHNLHQYANTPLVLSVYHCLCITHLLKVIHIITDCSVYIILCFDIE